MKTNQKINHTQKHSKPVKSKLIAALLGVGAALGVAGAIPAKAQPPESVKPAATQVSDATVPKESQRRTIAIEATFAEMSSQDLKTFGIDFVAQPPTVIASRTVLSIKGKAENPKPMPKDDTLETFAFGQVGQNFNSTLDTLIAQKRARILSKPNLNAMSNGSFSNTRTSVSVSIPLTIGPGGLVNTSDVNKAKMGKPNLYLTTSLGLDITPAINADGTITLNMRSPVQVYLQTGWSGGSGPLTTFSRSTQPVEVTTRQDKMMDAARLQVSPDKIQITADAVVFDNQLGGTSTAPQLGEITTSTQGTETVITLKDNGTIAIRGIRTRTIKYGKDGDKDLTMWSYVPTLGRLLNNDEGTEPEKELVVFVTARIVPQH